MKLLYLGNKTYNNKYRSLYKSLNIECVHYKNPLKAIDNLVEIEPDIFIMCKNEFPRLWKIVLSALRELFDEKKSIFILEGELEGTEIDAFNYLNGSLIVKDRNNDIELVKNKILEILPPTLLKDVYYPHGDEIGLGFVKPNDFSFVTAHITMMSETEFVFLVENIEDNKDLIDTVINDASISYGDEVITINFEIKNISNQLTGILLEKSNDYNLLISKLFI